MTRNNLSLLPEWASQERIFVGWPSHEEPWGDAFEAARAEIAAFVNLILSVEPPNSAHKTKVTLVLEGEAAAQEARAMVPEAERIDLKIGDVWLRDTGPIFVSDQAHVFKFNGWGGKYIYPGDDDLSERLSEHLGINAITHDFILEGGSIDHDGAGVFLTTEECLLNPNRNAGWTKARALHSLRQAFDVKELIWLPRGLAFDHTDGHIDNIARFVGPSHVVCQTPNGVSDPHSNRLEEAETLLRSWRGQAGERLSVSTLPSPGLVRDQEGHIMPASHLNFVITNQAVILPAYNDEAQTAVDVMQAVFPDRKVLSSPANAVLTGGGAFHCISQQRGPLGSQT